MEQSSKFSVRIQDRSVTVHDESMYPLINRYGTSNQKFCTSDVNTLLLIVFK